MNPDYHRKLWKLFLNCYIHIALMIYGCCLCISEIFVKYVLWNVVLVLSLNVPSILLWVVFVACIGTNFGVYYGI